MAAKKYRSRGPRDWAPGLVPGMVKGKEGEILSLQFIREIRSRNELPLDGLGFMQVQRLREGDPVEEYWIILEKPDKSRISPGRMLWFPTLGKAGVLVRGSVVGDFEEWTVAHNPLDALERWVADEMRSE